MKIRTAAITDIGLVREENEDRFLCDDKLGLYTVADGIGGLPAGAQAAQLTVDALEAAVRILPGGQSPDWQRIVAEVNERVFKLGRIIDHRMGIGSTLTFAYLLPQAIQVIHVGDSPCYRFRAPRLEKLTSDHNVETEFLRHRHKDSTAMPNPRHGQALTRCIGQPTPPEADVTNFPLIAGDRFLVCSDGISRTLRETELERLVAEASSPDELLKQCVKLANARGGGDNETGVAIFVDEV